MSRHEEQLQEAHELSGLLIRVSEQAKADFAEIAASLDLSVPVARAILHLSEPAPMRDLADHLACDRSYVTNIADQLEERGLVERAPGKDRRVKLLQLTPAGARTRDQVSERVARRALVLRRLDEEQRRTLRPLLEALLADDQSDNEAL